MTKSKMILKRRKTENKFNKETFFKRLINAKPTISTRLKRSSARIIKTKAKIIEKSSAARITSIPINKNHEEIK